MDKKYKNKEKGLTIILILLSIFAFIESYKINGKDITSSSPGAFPIFISVLLFVFSIWIFIENIKISSKKNEKNEDSKIFDKNILIFIILLILYGILIKWIGFIISTFAFLWTSISFFSKEKYLFNLGISVLTVTLIMIIFNTIFKVILP